MAANPLFASFLVTSLLVFPLGAKSEDYFGLRLDPSRHGMTRSLEADIVTYRLPGSDDFCGLFVERPVSVLEENYSKWYQDYWTHILDDRVVKDQLAGFSDKHDVGRGKGNVYHSFATVSVNRPPSTGRMRSSLETSVIGIYTAIFDSLVHPIVYYCENRTVHDVNFGYFIDILRDAMIILPGQEQIDLETYIDPPNPTAVQNPQPSTIIGNQNRTPPTTGSQQPYDKPNYWPPPDMSPIYKPWGRAG